FHTLEAKELIKFQQVERKALVPSQVALINSPKAVHTSEIVFLTFSQHLFAKAFISSQLEHNATPIAINPTIAPTTKATVPITGNIATLNVATAIVKVPISIIIGPNTVKNIPTAPTTSNMVCVNFGFSFTHSLILVAISENF